MNNQELLNSVPLVEAAIIISDCLVEQKRVLEQERIARQEEKKGYEQDFINANAHGDARENAALDAAQENLSLVTGKIVANAAVLNMLANIEDVNYLAKTYDYSEVKDCIIGMEPEMQQDFLSIFSATHPAEIPDRAVNMDIKVLGNRIDAFAVKYGALTGIDVRYDTCAARLVDMYKVLSRPKYNTCGIVVPYSTVRVALDQKIMTYRIYPKKLSFIDIGVISEESKMAQALFRKQVGDTFSLQHEGQRVRLQYRLLDLY